MFAKAPCCLKEFVNLRLELEMPNWSFVEGEKLRLVIRYQKCLAEYRRICSLDSSE